ncbi:TPA: ABC transporter substrate-binding protein [Streptococcus agalactiae]|nr:ABC transporter substrate-binding protein [Streptococcus agalactiae]
MTKYLKYISFVALFLASIFLVACQNQNSQTKERTRKQRPKDELVVSMGAKLPHEFDPKDRYGIHNEGNITHSTLLKRSPELDIKGELAKKYKISKDGLTWSFDLNDDFKFSNGEPVTADDVKFTYDMLKADGKAWDLTFIKNVEVVGKNQVNIHLTEAHSTFTAQLTEIPIVPKKHYNDKYKSNPIGSGPYMVKEYKAGEQAIFVRNPYWHGKNPYFKKWTWVLLDENTALAALESGDVDMIYATPELASKKVKGTRLLDIASNDVRGLSLPYVKKGVVKNSPDGYPVGNDVTSDPAIRKALTIGLNRQKVLDTVLNGYGKPAYSIIDRTPFWNPKTAIKDNKVAKAKQLLTKAGWKEQADGSRKKGNLKAEFDLYYPTNDQLRANLAVEVAEQAKALGITIKLKASNWDEMATKSHDSALLYAGGRHHAQQFYESHYPSLAGKGWTNITFYNNPTVTKYLDKAMTSPDLDKANKYWKLAQWDGKTGASTLGDLPNVWLVSLNHTYIGDKRINVGKQGVHSHGHDWSLLTNIAEWTWDESAK